MTEAGKVAEALDETEVIAPDGDVILLVGPDKVRLRVHSHALKMASKVFSAMLGPHFREGQGLNEFFPREISIPDDDPDAMMVTCNALHHCNNSLPTVISPISIVRFAMAADKYDCVVALKYVMSHWLDFTGITNSLELVYLAAAAYLFNNARGFEEATRRLIFGHRGSFTSLAEDEYGAVVPWKAFALLEAARSEKRAELLEILLDGAKYSDEACGCGHAGRLAQEYIRSLHDNGLLGQSLFKVSLEEACEKAAELEEYADPLIHSGRKCSWKRRHAELNTKKADGKKLFYLRQNVGLCLGCLRSGAADVSLPCGIEH